MAMHGRGEKKVKGFGGRHEVRRPFGNLRCRWQDGIRMDLRETGLWDVDWIHLAQDRDR
jgi:hypothetical protein